MHLNGPSLILLQAALSTFSFAFAEELKPADVPAACRTICQPIVELTAICDVNPNEAEGAEDEEEEESNEGAPEPDEAPENECFCTNRSFNVGSVAALCASCIEQNKSGVGAEGEEDSMGQLMAACGFSSTSYRPTATELVAQVTVSATKPAFTEAAPTAVAGGGGEGGTGTENKDNLGVRMGVSMMVVFGAAFLPLVYNSGIF
jgi:hypothetical protein